MEVNSLQSVLEIGENVAVEFKRCGNGIKDDTYETVCSFLNRFGGNLYLGVSDDGIVNGLSEKAAPDMVKNFISSISNPDLFSPTVYLTPKILKTEEGKTIIHIYIPPSAEVHKFKKVVYDRINDSDVKVTSTSQIAQMYIRKQNIFTEKRIFPYASTDDLRLDLLPRVRKMAVNNAGGKHPWNSMDDKELLESAGLYGRDIETGKRGYNLAALLLLGKDEVILNVCPAYMTDAVVRKVNIDRYDDREVVRTNLIESFDRLMEFARKNLPDKFFLEDINRVSLRNILAREMISNTLMHREYTSSYMAKFIIEKDCMYVENGNRAAKDGYITPDSLEPYPKNPIIASFFRNIGLADTLGSGTRNLFKYSKYYSGANPKFIEGDIFKILVPLDDNYSFDYGADKNDNDYIETNAKTDTKTNTKPIETDKTDTKTNAKSVETDTKTNAKSIETNTKTNTKIGINSGETNLIKLSANERYILNILKKNSNITLKEIADITNLSYGGVRYVINNLKEKGLVSRIGSSRSGGWKIEM